MSKSAFVMNTPERCVGCHFIENGYTGNGMNKKHVISLCRLNGRKIKNIESKPSWCLLRPLPEKLIKSEEITYWNAIADGWNACIDKIVRKK